MLGRLDVPLGLGLLRLSTEGRPSTTDAVTLIQLALNFGIRLLDTADVYGLDESDLHYGERLAASAVASWEGPREEVRVVTKVGLARRGDRWMPAGRPKAIRQAVEGSLRALNVSRLPLLMLHARDPNAPFEETLGVLAELQREGKVEHLGLCNTTAAELRQAGRHFVVAAVQNELSVLQRKSARDGLLALTAREGIVFMAHRPLGGHAKVARLEGNKLLRPLAERRRATPCEVAMAALLEAGPHVIPLIGATRAASLFSSVRALGLRLDASDRTALAVKYSFDADEDADLAPLSTQVDPAAPIPTDVARLAPDSDQPEASEDWGPRTSDEVVLLMGIQGAGKSDLVTRFVDAGYARLNRDLLGGRLDDLVPRVSTLLASGRRRIVLDNTYPTRLSRAPVIAAARAQGVPVRCCHLATPIGEAMINVVLRMIGKYGVPLGPEEMKRLGKQDPTLPPPQAMHRWANSFEPPAPDEGFAAIHSVPFVRRRSPAHTNKGLLLDVDGTLRTTLSGEKYPRAAEDQQLLPGRRETLARWLEAGYQLFFVSNQSGVASGRVSLADMQAAFLRTAELLRLPVTEVAYCPHPAHPVGCFCRKPLPGLGVYLMQRHQLDSQQLVMVGDRESDEGFAKAIGADFYHPRQFFGLGGPKPR